jgi:excisionase family DNA binding protein
MPDDWLRLKDIERKLLLSRSTVNTLLNEGEIPGAANVGNTRWRIDRREFLEWVAENA